MTVETDRLHKWLLHMPPFLKGLQSKLSRSSFRTSQWGLAVTNSSELKKGHENLFNLGKRLCLRLWIRIGSFAHLAIKWDFAILGLHSNCHELSRISPHISHNKRTFTTNIFLIPTFLPFLAHWINWSADDDDCFCYHSWRNNVVIAFGTLSSFLT